MRTIACASCLGVCGFAAASAVRPERACAQAPTPQPPEFPSEVGLVTIDAVVVDASGKAVEGLGKDDFVVEEDGQRQDVVNFEAVSVPVAAAAASAPAPSAISTNTPAERQLRRAFAILADDLRLPAEYSLQARRVMAGFRDQGQAQGPGH